MYLLKKSISTARQYAILVTVVFFIGCDNIGTTGFQQAISGRVTSSADGSPISNATVTYEGYYGPYRNDTYTAKDVSNGKGEFELTWEVDEGCPKNQRISIQAFGYEEYSASTSFNNPQQAFQFVCRVGVQTVQIELDPIGPPTIEAVEPDTIDLANNFVYFEVWGTNFTHLSKLRIGGVEFGPDQRLGGPNVYGDRTRYGVELKAWLLQPGIHDVSIENHAGVATLPSAVTVR